MCDPEINLDIAAKVEAGGFNLLPDEDMGREAALAHIQDLTTLLEATRLALDMTVPIARNVRGPRPSWREIGDAAGMTFQSAYQRWNAAAKALEEERGAQEGDDS